MTQDFIAQFGETLYKSSDGTNMSPSDALIGKDYIMLYFSAKWCPPCTRFTPILIEFYNKIKTSNNIEIVFCSLDNDEDQYKQYTSKMPWLSMPFEAKETIVMAGKYNADGIPHLVVINGSSGEVITEDGTEGVYNDVEGKNFPWKPKSFAELMPSQLLSSKSSKEKLFDYKTLNNKYLMLYFSAHWCPPCRAFTPRLSEAYTKMKAERDDFDLVFVSSDRDEESFNEYFESMTFCALPFEYRDTKAALSKMFGVSGIPCLVMLGPASKETGDRPLINKNIRGFIEKGDFTEFPFYKKNYGSVDDVDNIHEVKSLIIFHEYGDDQEQNDVKEVAKEVALKVKEDNKEINVLWALSASGIAARIRKLTSLPEISESANMILLDIPDNGGYYTSDKTDITFENVISFVENPGDRLQLS